MQHTRHLNYDAMKLKGPHIIHIFVQNEIQYKTHGLAKSSNSSSAISPEMKIPLVFAFALTLLFFASIAEAGCGRNGCCWCDPINGTPVPNRGRYRSTCRRDSKFVYPFKIKTETCIPQPPASAAFHITNGTMEIVKRMWKIVSNRLLATDFS